MRLLAVIVGALLGVVAGYMIGVFVACSWLYPGSNLCGIVGVFITGPLGLVGGAVAGWLLSRPRGR
jgi:hypothetical protein